MFCPKCGTKNSDNAAFCANCGTKLERRVAAPAQAPNQAPDQAAFAPGAPSVSRYAGNYTAAKRRGKKPIIAAVAAVAVVAIAAFVCYKAFFEPYPINVETFPDGTFRAYVLTNIDVNHDGQLSRDEAKSVVTLGTYDESDQSYNDTLASQSIASLKGIEYFTELKSLAAHDNPLTTVDLSKNTKLQQVNLQSDTLQTVDVSGCNDLTTLWVGENTQVQGANSNLKENLMMTQYTDSYSGSSSSSSTYKYTYALDGKLTDVKQSGKDTTITDHYTYDTNGNCSSDVHKSGSTTTNITYEFNDKNLLAKSVRDTGDYTYTYAFTYDDAGNAATYAYTSAKNSNVNYSLSQNFTFANNVLTAVSAAEQNYGTKDSTLTYNADGTCASLTCTYSSNGTTYTYTYAYDSQGRLATKTTSRTGGSSSGDSVTTYTWNADGTEVTEATQNSSSSFTYKLDGSGHLTELCCYIDGKLSSKYAFTYAKGAIIEKEVYETYNTSKGTVSSTTTKTASYAKLYSTTDYESRVSDYQIKYPYQSAYFNGGMSQENYFYNYKESMTKTISPAVVREQIFQTHS